jgi:hypothetical protein
LGTDAAAPGLVGVGAAPRRARAGAAPRGGRAAPPAAVRPPGVASYGGSGTTLARGPQAAAPAAQARWPATDGTRRQTPVRGHVATRPRRRTRGTVGAPPWQPQLPDAGGRGSGPGGSRPLATAPASRARPQPGSLAQRPRRHGHSGAGSPDARFPDGSGAVRGPAAVRARLRWLRPLSARARGLRPRPLAAQPLRGRMALSRGPGGAAVRQRVRGPVEGASPACGRAGEQPRQRPLCCLNSASAALTRARGHGTQPRSGRGHCAVSRPRRQCGHCAGVRPRHWRVATTQTGRAALQREMNWSRSTTPNHLRCMQSDCVYQVVVLRPAIGVVPPRSGPRQDCKDEKLADGLVPTVLGSSSPMKTCASTTVGCGSIAFGFRRRHSSRLLLFLQAKVLITC